MHSLSSDEQNKDAALKTKRRATRTGRIEDTQGPSVRHADVTSPVDVTEASLLLNLPFLSDELSDEFATIKPQNHQNRQGSENLKRRD